MEAESTYHSGLNSARETWWAMRLDLLMVVFTMVIVAHCSVIEDRRGRVGTRGLRGLRADGESKRDEWEVAAAATYLGEWL